MTWTMPDLYLKVTRITANGEPHLNFDLSGTKLGRPQTNMGTTPVGSGYEKVLEDVLYQWEEQCRENALSLGSSFSDTLLRQKGARLFELVLPETLQQHLWQFRHEARDLIIECAEPIPWELMFLQDPHSERGDDFLCLRYHLARWLPESNFNTDKKWMPAQVFKMKPLALIQGDRTDLGKAMEESTHLMEGHQAWKPQLIDSNYKAINRALASATYGAWHFVGHGLLGKNSGREMTMLLESGEELTSDILTLGCRSAGKHRPLVFWNCCYSSRSARAFGLHGWPDAFLKHGFGSFIGTLWAVEDGAARTFSLFFYQALAGGSDLGEAMNQARREVRSQGSNDWLAYVLYGDPRARHMGPGQEHPVSDELLQKMLGDPALRGIHKALLEALGVIGEPVPGQVLARFAEVEEVGLPIFIETWQTHLNLDQQRIYPKNSLRRNIQSWTKRGLLDLEQGHQRIVSALLLENHGKDPIN